MQQFLQSTFLHALANGLLSGIWQMALLWLVTVMLFKAFRLSSAQKFAIAFIAQLSGFLLFIYTCFYAYNSGWQKIAYGETSSNFLLNINKIITELMPYAAALYLCLLLFKLVQLAFNYRHTKGLKNYDLTKMPADKRIFVKQMSALFSLKKKVSIYVSAKINCPLTIGFLKPVILIPVAAINHLTTEQMEAVILHELAHIKRADYLLFMLQAIIDKIFFFNIFSLMLSAIIERERENACDDWVLQFKYNSMHYAEALFKLGRLKASPVFAMQLTGKKDNLLLMRIQRLLHNSQHKNTFNLQSALTGLLSLMIVAALIFSAAIQFKPEQKIKITAAVFTKNENKSVAAFTDKKLAPFKIAAVKDVKKNSGAINQSFYKQDQIRQKTDESELSAQANLMALKQNYLVQVKAKLDSIKNALPQYQQALNSQLIVTPDVVRKAISYQNFRQIEDMLAASGDSVTVKESDASKNSYQKEITIEAKDKNGNKHVYTVIVQLYQ